MNGAIRYIEEYFEFLTIYELPINQSIKYKRKTYIQVHLANAFSHPLIPRITKF